MEESSVTNHLYDILNQSANIIEKKLRVGELEALHLTGLNIYTDEIEQAELVEELQPLYDRFFIEGMTAEDVRRAFQLAVLKRMKGTTQPGHQMTPDAIAIFIGYLVGKLFPLERIRLLDLACGTGNLLTSVVNQIDNRAEAYGVEIDDTLINLAETNSNLQQHTIELFHQDALRPLLLDLVDVTMGDLPVGYYPDEEQAQQFRLGQHSERIYSPYLMIEQGMNYLKPGGYGLYLVPNGLFDWDDNHDLHRLLQSEAVVLGLMELPESMFKGEQHAKSILMLRKQGPHVKTPDQALLAKLPSFKDQKALLDMTQQIDQWFEQYLK